MSIGRAIYKVKNNIRLIKYCYSLYSSKNDQSESKNKL